MEPDGEYYSRAIGRIYRLVIVLSVAGAALVLSIYGWQAGLGFLVGGAASYFNFHWLHGLVLALGAGGKRPGKRLAFFLVSRYFLFAIIAYVIVKYFGVNLVAALWGLCVSVAAVMLEILYELIYART